MISTWSSGTRCRCNDALSLRNTRHGIGGTNERETAGWGLLIDCQKCLKTSGKGIKANGVQQFATSPTATRTHMPYEITELPATQRR